jgi:hypothetical protein
MLAWELAILVGLAPGFQSARFKFPAKKQVFAALDPVERKILSKRSDKQDDPYERPFQKPLEKLDKDVTATVRYPSKDERFGSVSMGWRLPGDLWEAIPNIQVGQRVTDSKNWSVHPNE